MFKALVSRGSKALQRLDERLNDEGEEDAFEEGWGEEERKALEPVSIDDVDVDDRDALRRRISKLQGMVVSMEEALEAEVLAVGEVLAEEATTLVTVPTTLTTPRLTTTLTITSNDERAPMPQSPILLRHTRCRGGEAMGAYGDRHATTYTITTTTLTKLALAMPTTTS